MHEQKFKDLLSSICLTSSERSVSDSESQVMGGLRSMATSGNILSLFFFSFHVVKPLMPIFALLPMLCVCEKLDRFKTRDSIGLFP